MVLAGALAVACGGAVEPQEGLAQARECRVGEPGHVLTQDDVGCPCGLAGPAFQCGEVGVLACIGWPADDVGGGDVVQDVDCYRWPDTCRSMGCHRPR